MIFNQTYADLECAVLLKEKGFNWFCEYMYAKRTRVSDEIYQKHPGLSDDGYLDLTDEYGGPYKYNDVYKTYLEPYKSYCKNTPEYLNEEWRRMVCAMPTLTQARAWLRTIHHIDIVVFPIKTGYKADVILPDEDDNTKLGCISLRVTTKNTSTDNPEEVFTQYEQAEQEAIRMAIKHVSPQSNAL